MLYTDKIIIRISTQLKDKATEKANTEDKTISDYIRNLIIEDLKKD